MRTKDWNSAGGHSGILGVCGLSMNCDPMKARVGEMGVGGRGGNNSPPPPSSQMGMQVNSISRTSNPTAMCRINGRPLGRVDGGSHQVSQYWDVWRKRTKNEGSELFRRKNEGD